jgi:hypothetical protein
MSHQLRYTVEESEWDWFEFDVMDHKEKQSVCSCHQRKNAGIIAGLLNKNWEEEVKIQQGAGEGW